MKIHFGAAVRRTVVGAAASAVVLVPLAAAVSAAQAAGTIRSAISLTAPTAAPYGAKVTLSGVLWRYQTATKIAGAKVTLQRANKGKANWTSVTSVNTSSTGTYAFSVTQGLAYDYRTVYAGSAVYTAAISPVRYPVVMQRVFLDSVKTISYETGVLRAAGRLYPATGARVYLQRKNPGTGAWVNIGSKVASGNTVSVDAKVGGSTGQYRLYAPMTYPYGAGYSAAKTFSHYVYRGLFKRPVIGTGGTGNPEFQVISEDPDRYAAISASDPTGSVWADVNTSGCTRLEAYFANFAGEALGVKITKSGTALADVTISGWTGQDPRIAYRAVATGGASKLRLEFYDAGNAEPLQAVVASRVLCAN